MTKSGSKLILVITLLLLAIVACEQSPEEDEPATATLEIELGETAVSPSNEQIQITSPDGQIAVTFSLEDGKPFYQVSVDGQAIINPSQLGFVFKEGQPLDQNLAISSSEQSSFDETWTQVWGEVQEIRNHYNELHLELTETTKNPRQMNIIFRVYDDGLGFRYELPQQPHLQDFEIMDEETEFALTGDHQAWWIPAYWQNRYEYLYTQSALSHIWREDVQAVHTPLTLQTAANLTLSIHEASLINYASMTLMGNNDNNTLQADLVPWSDGTKVKGRTPLQTPWRTIQIAHTPGDLITSYLILNLNEPNKLADTSWIHPGKYVGIWWEMHLDLATWGSGDRHGATTENTMRYLDFAAANGFDGVLVEGWNTGWDGDWTAHGDRFSFTEPYPDFDLEAVTAYAAAKGVRLIGHHETGAGIQNYEEQMADAFALYASLGVNAVKTGYVGWGQGIKRRSNTGNIRGLEWHHGQFMVEHHQRVVETAAQYHIMINIHEPIKDTGLRRTYPNLLTREGARGQEYNAWDAEGGNPPDHVTILPFTRMLAGPMDYTPGIFNLTLAESRPNNRINHTLAKELALYVILYSPLQMAADLPQNYENQPAFQFIRDVPVDWRETQVLHAAIGEYVTIVRQDRHSQDWYLGSVTDENGRSLSTPLTFLAPDQTYVAEIYADALEANWDSNPLAIDIQQVLVNNETVMNLQLAPGGGQAIRFRPATATEAESLPFYEP
jgi:alpha-glucosidase